MKYNIVFQPRAISEIQISIDYYDEQQVGLGKEFYTELFEYIDAIIANPFYKIYSGNIRVVPLKNSHSLFFIGLMKLKNVFILKLFFIRLKTQKNTLKNNFLNWPFLILLQWVYRS